MKGTPEEAERWHFGGRYYLPTYASTPTSMDLEVDDVGPGVGLGNVLIASRDDESGQITVWCHADHDLPTELIEHALASARANLPPTSA